MRNSNPFGVIEELQIKESDPRVWLQLWVSTLLTYTNDPGYWHFLCREYFNKSCDRIGIDEQNPVEMDREDTILSTGKAISTLSAAQCTWQGSRTAKFIHGIRAAIRDLQERFPGEKLRILYAGCGPLAPLALPLLAHFGCDQLTFDCLDIHAASLDHAKTLAGYYGVESGIRSWICADASTFTPDTGYHLIISEVMQQALQNEPQVAVMIHLSQFLVEGGVFVPERVQLSLQYYDLGSRTNALLSGGGEITQFTRLIADVFELSLENARKWRSLKTNWIPAAKVTVPQAPSEKFSPYIFTNIQVYGTVWMGAYECSLNLPVKAAKLLSGQSEVEFRYEICKIPGLRVVG